MTEQPVPGAPPRLRVGVVGTGRAGAVLGAALARTDPQAYADALEEASYASELLDPAGLGAFRWRCTP